MWQRKLGRKQRGRQLQQQEGVHVVSRGRVERCGHASAGRGRGWGQGRGVTGVDLGGDSERENFDSLSLSTESDGEDSSGSSDTAMSGVQDENGDIYQGEAVDGPHLPAPPTEQDV